MSKISVLQVNESRDFSGLVLKDSLAALGHTQPNYINKMVTLLYRHNYQVGISDYLMTTGRKQIVSRDEDGFVKWRLQGSSLKTVPLLRATDIAGNAISATSKFGLGKSRFYMYFSSKQFTDVHIIVGKKGSSYQIRVVSDPAQTGASEFRYEVELFGGDLSKFVPYDCLQPGDVFSVDGAYVEDTFSKKGAGFNYTSNFEMKNTYSMARWEDTVPSNMKNRSLQWTLRVTDDKGKTSDFMVWDDYASWEKRVQMNIIKNRMINYGKFNADANGALNDFGKSGFTIRTGAGIQEQMESANKDYFSKFNIDALLDRITDLSTNTKGFAEKRDVLVRTGKWGYKLAMEQIKAKATQLSLIQTDKFITSGKDGGYGLNANFTQFTNSDGATVSFMVEPMFDDETDARNSVMMSELVPGLAGSARSYTYEILDLGGMNGMNNNVELYYVEQEADYYSILPGPRSLYRNMAIKEGKDSWALSASDVDGTKYTYITPEFCVVIKDPTRIEVMKPSILD